MHACQSSTLAGNCLRATHKLDVFSHSLVSHPIWQGIAWEQLTGWMHFYTSLSVIQLGREWPESNSRTRHMYNKFHLDPITDSDLHPGCVIGVLVCEWTWQQQLGNTHLLHGSSGAFHQFVQYKQNLHTYLLHRPLLQISFARTWTFPYRFPLDAFF